MRLRLQPDGAQGGHGGDKAVDDHRPPGGGSAQERAAHGGNVQAAHLGKNVYHIGFVRPVCFDGAADDLFFSLKGLVRDAAAPAGHLLRRHVQQRAEHGGGGGGVADAHFSHAQGIRLRVDGHSRAGENGGDGLLSGHGGHFGNVIRPIGDLAVQHRFVVDFSIHAHVAHRDAHPKVTAQGGGPGLGPGQIDGLL